MLDTQEFDEATLEDQISLHQEYKQAVEIQNSLKAEQCMLAESLATESNELSKTQAELKHIQQQCESLSIQRDICHRGISKSDVDKAQRYFQDISKICGWSLTSYSPEGCLYMVADVTDLSSEDGFMFTRDATVSVALVLNQPLGQSAKRTHVSNCTVDWSFPHVCFIL